MVSDSQPPTSPVSSSSPNDAALLERARLALQALQYEAEAARYRVACAELMEAIADAEAGNAEPLKQWLFARRDSTDLRSGESTSKTIARGTPQTVPSAVTAVVSRNEIVDPAGSTQDLIQSTSVAQKKSSAQPAIKPLKNTQPGLEPPLAAKSERSFQSRGPWDRMVKAAEARAKVWLESEQVVAPELTPSSLDLALSAGKMDGAPTKKKSARLLAQQVSVSLVVHALMIAVLAWWVVVIAQPEKQLSISVGENDFQEVALETTLEQEPSEMTPSEDPESAPTTDAETLPIDVPRIAAIESGVGPPIANSNLSTMAGNLSGAGGMGTNLAAGAEFFGAKAAGNTFVFVVDCSPSMARDKAFDSAKTEILRSLSMLKPKQRFYILFFGAEIAPLQFGGLDPEPYMVRANPENLEKTLQWIQRINIQKEGRHPIDAVRQAIDMDPDAIFLLFDGDTKVNNWIGRIREMNQTDDLFSQGETKIPIHVVHFFREEFVADMRRLAEENQGSYRFVPRPKKGTNR
jgi:hypothetical protein